METAPHDARPDDLIAGLPEIDWSATPLGPPPSWSDELRTAAGIVLASRFPMALVWREGLTTLHNEAFRSILGAKPDGQGQSFAEIWHEAWVEIGPIMNRALVGEATFIENFPLRVDRHGYPEQACFTFCYSPVRGADGKVVGVIDTVVETTATVQANVRNAALVTLGDRLREAVTPAEAAIAPADLLGQTLGAARAGYAVIDERAGTFVIEQDWTREGVATIAGRYDNDAFNATLSQSRTGEIFVLSDVANDPRLAVDMEGYRAFGIVAQIAVPLIERGEMVGVLYVHHDHPRVYSDEEVAFVRAVADRTYAALARLAAEAEQEVLNRELDHRLKNMMAMVQSIAVQTLRAVEDRDAVEAFQERLVALSRAHDLLVGQGGTRTTICEVVEATRDLHGADRFELSGRDRVLGPKAALSLSLILHELATNAVKYGALSVEGGKIAIDWAADDDALRLGWCEQGGPPVAPPIHNGFGSRLIRMGLANTGEVERHYRPEGFEAIFRAPLALLEE